MKKIRLSTALATLSLVSLISLGLIANAQDYKIEQDVKKQVQALRQEALESPLAYKIVESLTTEIGPRLAGSEAEARARDWGLKLGKNLGFDRVTIEEFTMPFWHRGKLSIRLSAPYQQDLYGTALGGSGMSKSVIDAPLVYFRDLAALENTKENSLKGKIAFVDG